MLFLYGFVIFSGFCPIFIFFHKKIFSIFLSYLSLFNKEYSNIKGLSHGTGYGTGGGQGPFFAYPVPIVK